MLEKHIELYLKIHTEYPELNWDSAIVQACFDSLITSKLADELLKVYDEVNKG